MNGARREYRRSLTPVVGGTYCVHEWLAPDEPSPGPRLPLLLLHGFTANGAAWEEPQRSLVSPSAVIAPDLPGHGDTELAEDGECFTFEGAARALERVLDARDIEHCVVHGYSMGGRLALYFSLTRPWRVAALSLESASAGLASPQQRDARRRADEELARIAIDRGIGAFVDHWERVPVLASQLRLSATVRMRLRERRLRNRPEGLAASLRGMGTGAQPYLGDRLAGLAMPVSVMAGADDAKFVAVATDLVASIAAAELCVVDGAGHSPHLEQPRRWADAVEQWLTRAPK